MKPRSLYCAAISFLAAVVPTLAHAAVEFSEVMYDAPGTDTGHEWIEVHNAGTDAVDLSAYKLFEANTNHRLTAVGAASVPAGGYAVIADDEAKFRTDNAGFTGLLFTSAFSLGNAGEALVLRDASGADADALAYDVSIGAAGDGNSLQKSAAGPWIAVAPTPGSHTTAMQSVAPPADDSDASGSEEGGSTGSSGSSSGKNTQTYSSYRSQEVANVSYDAPEFQVTSGRARFGFVGMPLQFEAKIKSAKNIPEGNAPGHTWSMGDGTQESGQFISHVYEYPGDYVVILNSGYGGAEAVSRVEVKIVEAQVTIAEANQDFVEIANADDREVNIGSWALQSASSRFVLPFDTIIAAKSSIRIPARAARLSDTQGFLYLANPSGKVYSTTPFSGGSAPLFGMPGDMSEEAVRARIASFIKPID
jgi:hypothetical protein